MRTVLRGALVVDGTGGAPYRADAVLDGGRVAALHREGDPGPRPGGGRVVDADGLVLAPGFVDMHAHSDLALLTDPAHEAKVAQGVTLEVLGQDGLSYAPVDDTTLAGLRRQIAGWNGDPADADFDWSWRSVGEYLDRLDAQGIAVNAAYLVPQGTLRALVLGWEDRPATPAELERMRQVLAQSLAEGAVGMSSGLTYTPGMYADTAELTALCQVVADHGGYWCPHHRSYGAGALEAYAEVVGIARAAGCALHLAHATMNFEVNRGRAGELLSLVDAALADGVDVTLDTYPYLPGSTTLAALLPGWAAAGGPAETLRRLTDPAARARIRADLEVHGSDGCHGVVADWHTVQVSGVREPALRPAVGLTVHQLARRDGVEPFQAFTDLLVADGLGTTILQHVGHEGNVRAIMRHPVHCGGSDGLLVGDRPHPRAWGTFPRYLGTYVRESGILSLPEAVRHLAATPARRLGLRDRGQVHQGWVADLVLLDPESVAEQATFDEPRRLPRGIPYVFVDGVAVMDDGRRTGALPGRSVRRGGRARQSTASRATSSSVRSSA
ncbi:N-acyl-D-amino-acid deacylase family protein [Streptacidiphilus jiangxiensis]|uniref:N-acyl-D-amino-acid deacylase n=1 Tax=Streptacidiphilus jiangxiensis TaxID=235985 RepID=A0A1H7FQS0_STRJI|nr:D-aminoacylase [Streptacidiphilus jiangxiensis]SEK26530.1 N-acyl-D-amino-acid deacylase [Streptacidiphilus jiangxiensis]